MQEFLVSEPPVNTESLNPSSSKMHLSAEAEPVATQTATHDYGKPPTAHQRLGILTPQEEVSGVGLVVPLNYDQQS